MTKFDKETVTIVLEHYLSGEKLEELKGYTLEHLVEIVAKVYTEPFKQARVLHELFYGSLVLDKMLTKEDMTYINKNVLDINTMDTVVKTMNKAIISNRSNVLLKLRTTDKTIKFITELVEDSGFKLSCIEDVEEDTIFNAMVDNGVTDDIPEYTHLVILQAE